MLEEGIYKVKVRSWGVTKAKTGTPQIYFEVVATERANNPDDVKSGFDPLDRSAIRTIYMALTPNTQERVFSELRYLGYDRTTFRFVDLDPSSPTAHNFEGLEFLARCNHDEYKGKKNEKWQVKKSRSFEPLSGGAAESFDNLFDAAFREHLNTVESVGTVATDNSF
jgi:hypothetical protein